MKWVIIFLACFSASVLGFSLNKLPTQVNAPNPDESGIFTESDLILTADQLMNPQNGLLHSYYRWENAIVPYTISGAFTSAQVIIIEAALAEIARQTCIKFVKRTTEANYVDITNDASGCWSYVGCVRGAQTLNLQSSAGCVTKGVTMHEMLHALGFFHSHSDTARDSYVTINYDNIATGKDYNFVLYTNSYVTDFGQGYDYKSIMHYSAYAFTKNNLKTIEVKDPTQVIGQRSALSELDVKKINLMYSCTAFL